MSSASDGGGYLPPPDAYSIRAPFRRVQKSRPGKNAAYGGGPSITYQVVDADGKLVATMHGRMDGWRDALRLVDALNHWYAQDCPRPAAGINPEERE